MRTYRKPMPVGIEDFKKLIDKQYCFVDKTRFIRELLDTPTDVTLITRPRRFGKTLTLSMLRYFFTMENAEDNRHLFAGLDIERADEDYMAEQGSRPVIFLTLKNAQSLNMEDELTKIAMILSRLYGNFPFLQTSPNLAEIEHDFFLKVRNNRASQPDMEDALINLCQMLTHHYGRKPILLLDEYDAPILAAWEHGYYEKCIAFMKSFLGGALKSNDDLDFAVLTGVTRISKEGIFHQGVSDSHTAKAVAPCLSGLNNLDVCSILSDSYADIFGFTQHEAEVLMKEAGVEENLPQLKQWYDGYRFGQEEIYNPWSVINFIKNGCKFQPYWLNTSGNSILKDLLLRVDQRRQRELEGLLEGKAVEAPIMENVIYSDLQGSRDALFMMLMTAGYLKPVETWKDEYYVDWAKLQIPNVEVRTAYRREILGHIVPSQGETLLKDMLHAMTEGNVQAFEEHLNEILRDYVSYHDPATQPENFYHGLLLGLSGRDPQARPGGYGVHVLDGVRLIEGVHDVFRQRRIVVEHDHGLFAVEVALLVGALGIGPDLKDLLSIRTLHDECPGGLGVVLGGLPPGELHLGGRCPRLVPGGEIPLLQLIQLALPVFDLVLFLSGRAIEAGEPVIDELLHLGDLLL